MARSKYAKEAYMTALSIEEPNTQVGVGVDMVEVERMRKIMERTPAFCGKIFSPDEVEYCMSKSNPPMHFAARFAAKEAVVKALGTGFSEGVGVRDIEVVSIKGKPSVSLSGRALEVSQKLDITDIEISLSHTNTEAIAFVVAISKLAKDKAQEKDPVKELAQKFKEAKAMFDEVPSNEALIEEESADPKSDQAASQD